MYRVLFVLPGDINPESGGVSRVCDNLAREMFRIGYYVFAISSSNSYSASQFVKSWLFPHPDRISEGNRAFVKQICEEIVFDFIILEAPESSWLLDSISYVYKESIVIGHFHNSPYGIYSYSKSIHSDLLACNKFVKLLLFNFRRIQNKRHYSRLLKMAKVVVLLSSKYKKEFYSLSSFPENRLVGIANPFPLIGVECSSFDKKNNTILFVGRVTNAQKRLSSILNMWKSIQERLPDWDLKIVGGGDELPFWMSRSKEMGLQRITFEGYKDPNPYYESSKVLVLMSLYEGFPMVLVEAMQRGCVPVVFDSFAALSEIIDNNENGLIVKAYKQDQFVKAVFSLTHNETLLKQMSQCAFEKAKVFDSKVIGYEWESLFKRLKG